MSVFALLSIHTRPITEDVSVAINVIDNGHLLSVSFENIHMHMDDIMDFFYGEPRNTVEGKLVVSARDSMEDFKSELKHHDLVNEGSTYWWDIEYPDEECPICREHLRFPFPMVTNPCGHWFHSRCFHTWTARVNSCPLCRAPNPH
jgi:hypothetical protein